MEKGNTKICYDRQFLLKCAQSPLCGKFPSNWDQEVLENPNVMSSVLRRWDSNPKTEKLEKSSLCGIIPPHPPQVLLENTDAVNKDWNENIDGSKNLRHPVVLDVLKSIYDSKNEKLKIKNNVGAWENPNLAKASNSKIEELKKENTEISCKNMDVLQRKYDYVKDPDFSSENQGKNQLTTTRVLYLPWFFSCEICNYKARFQGCFEKHLAGKNHREMMEIKGGIGYWRTSIMKSKEEIPNM